MTTQEATRINNNLSKGKMWQGPTLQRLGRRKCMEDLNLCAINATIFMMGSMLLSAPTARGLAKDCRSPTATTNNQRAPGANQRLKNNNRGNQAGNDGATTRDYAVGIAGKSPDANVVTGMFLLNNQYASILFDTGADRSFMSTAFSSLIDIIPTALDHDYDVGLAKKNNN
ncbi:putative reverse transcriptase domain-containing protein [Tanacetum coccineum]